MHTSDFLVARTFIVSTIKVFTSPPSYPKGVLEVYMMEGGGGGLTYFLGLKIYTLCTFLGQEIGHIFLGLKNMHIFWVASVEQKGG